MLVGPGVCVQPLKKKPAHNCDGAAQLLKAQLQLEERMHKAAVMQMGKPMNVSHRC